MERWQGVCVQVNAVNHFSRSSVRPPSHHDQVFATSARRDYMRRILFITLLALLILYLGDYLSVRYRIPKTRNPFGTVKIQRYYAVGLKNRKTEFMFLEPENQVCVHSLFPHFGYSPCWYLSRKKVKRIDL
jgi:hypothetical protein